MQEYYYSFVRRNRELACYPKDLWISRTILELCVVTVQFRHSTDFLMTFCGRVLGIPRKWINQWNPGDPYCLVALATALNDKP